MGATIRITPSQVYKKYDLSRCTMFHCAYISLDWIQILLTKRTHGITDDSWFFYKRNNHTQSIYENFCYHKFIMNFT